MGLVCHSCCCCVATTVVLLPYHHSSPFSHFPSLSPPSLCFSFSLSFCFFFISSLLLFLSPPSLSLLSLLPLLPLLPILSLPPLLKDQAAKEKAIAGLSSMSSAQIVSASILQNTASARMLGTPGITGNAVPMHTMLNSPGIEPGTSPLPATN